MSQFNDELMGRLACNALLPPDERAQDLADVRGWYLEQLSTHRLYWRDLTPGEQRFLTEVMQSYEAWRQSRESPKPN
jgi:hypothetical protein